MKTHITAGDVFNTNRTVVDMGNSFDFQFIAKNLSPEFYNAGIYGWNYDVYDANGMRFLYGDRTPSRGRQNWSTKVLKSLASEARKLRVWDKDYNERMDELMKKFCESVEKGIRDPAPVTSYGNFKKQLVEQKEMFPDESLVSIAKELLGEIPYKKRSEVEAKIRTGFAKDGFSFNEERPELLEKELARLVFLKKNKAVSKLKVETLSQSR